MPSRQPRCQGLSSYRLGRARREKNLSSLAQGGKMIDPGNEVGPRDWNKYILESSAPCKPHPLKTEKDIWRV